MDYHKGSTVGEISSTQSANFLCDAFSRNIHNQQDQHGNKNVFSLVTATISMDFIKRNLSHEVNDDIFLSSVIADCQVDVVLQNEENSFQISGSLSSIICLHLHLSTLCGVRIIDKHLSKYIRKTSQTSSMNKTIVTTKHGRVVKCNPDYVNYIRSEQDPSTEDSDYSAPNERVGSSRARPVRAQGLGRKKVSDQLDSFYDCESSSKAKFKCNVCSYASSRSQHLERHKELHAKSKNLRNCSQCNFTSMSQAHLRRHEVKSHATRKLRCNKCRYITDDMTLMRRHKRVKHSQDKLILKDKAWEKRSSPHGDRVIEGHTSYNKNSESFYTCAVCNYQSLLKHHMVRHVTAVHSETRPFLCDLCGKSFKRKDGLDQHKFCHADITGSLQYQCAACSRSFGSKASLVKHSLSHSTQRTWLCDHCGAKFKTRNVQQKHIRTIHLNPRSFKCVWCSKLFSTQYILKRHLETHVNSNTLKNTEKTSQSISNYFDMESRNNLVFESRDSVLTDEALNNIMDMQSWTNQTSKYLVTSSNSSLPRDDGVYPAKVNSNVTIPSDMDLKLLKSKSMSKQLNVLIAPGLNSVLHSKCQEEVSNDRLTDNSVPLSSKQLTPDAHLSQCQRPFDINIGLSPNITKMFDSIPMVSLPLQQTPLISSTSTVVLQSDDVGGANGHEVTNSGLLLNDVSDVQIAPVLTDN